MTLAVFANLFLVFDFLFFEPSFLVNTEPSSLRSDSSLSIESYWSFSMYEASSSDGLDFSLSIYIAYSIASRPEEL